MRLHDTGHKRTFFLLLLPLVVEACCSTGQAEIADPAWLGKGRFRILVRVQPGPTEAVSPLSRVQKRDRRTFDERPAELKVDLAKLLAAEKVTDVANVASLQVIRFDPKTGAAMDVVSRAHALGAHDAPFRWYDGDTPYEFPEFPGAITRSKGVIERRSVTRGGHFFNVLGSWRRGRLTWMHRQQADQPSWYAIYFDCLAGGVSPSQLPPRCWIGDGVPRAALVGETTLGADHCRIDWADWNGDGLPDLVAGEHYGHVFWLPNVGDAKRPSFRFARFVRNADGEPLDVGMAAAPKVVDWDNDGDSDLLVGTEWNRILYYCNDGDDKNRRLRYRGPLELEPGKPLELPVAPLERGSTQVFKRDYYPVLETVDWDGDGDVDLLAGGYVTGRVFLYENKMARKDGAPLLRYRGPLEADDRPLNVGHWCASPCAVDLDGDGDLDLLSGNMPMHLEPGEKTLPSLLYFENQGAARLRSVSFPGVGSFSGRLATPRTTDWDGDGDLDLAVGSRENIFLFENVGTAAKPQFQLHHKPIRFPWGLASLAVDQFRDWDGDGRRDLVHNYTVALNSGVGNPYRWKERVNILPSGETIQHPSGIGDDWFWPHLDDFDQDGRVDVLFGDWFGHVWFHRNTSKENDRRFDLRGARLLTRDGKPIKVGPIGKDPTKDFDALQGARTVFTAADFDRDGRRDLVVGDTYGILRLFRNVSEQNSVRFASGVAFGDLGIRLLVDTTDWNDDGWPDVIAGAANGRVQLFLNRAGEGREGRFAAGQPLKLPPIMQPRVLMSDINGDGDEDLFLPSTQGSCFVERSFLKHGYANAQIVKFEQRQAKR